MFDDVSVDETREFIDARVAFFEVLVQVRSQEQLAVLDAPQTSEQSYASLREAAESTLTAVHAAQQWEVARRGAGYQRSDRTGQGPFPTNRNPCHGIAAWDAPVTPHREEYIPPALHEILGNLVSRSSRSDDEDTAGRKFTGIRVPVRSHLVRCTGNRAA